jgi:hypothetical protein
MTFKTIGRIEKHSDFDSNKRYAENVAKFQDPLNNGTCINHLESDSATLRANDTYLVACRLKAIKTVGTHDCMSVEYNQSSYAFERQCREAVTWALKDS